MVTLATDLLHALDAARWAARTLPFPLDDWQRDVLRSRARQIVLLCSRQAGKSTAAAALGVHEALYGPPAPTLLIAPSLRQSQELFRVVKDLYGQAQLEGAPAIRQESALSLELETGARIISLPGGSGEDVGRTVRGYAGVRLLVVDEASRVPDPLYRAIRPMLAVSDGRICLLSTPYGQRGFFHAVWTEGGAEWKRIKITADQVPRIPRGFLERERQSLPDWVYRQEYACEFVETEDSAFAYADIMAALDPRLEPLFGIGATNGTGGYVN